MTIDDIPEIARLTESLKLNLTLAAKAGAGKLEIGLSYPCDIPALRAALNERALAFFMDRAEADRLALQAIATEQTELKPKEDNNVIAE